MKTYPEKAGLIRLEAAADYLGCSHQYLGKMLNDEHYTHPLRDYFRHYAGYWRTTYALLDEYFTNGKVVTKNIFLEEKTKGEDSNDTSQSSE